MYIHLGHETVVRETDVIGIFDLDSTTISKHTRKFLNNAEKQGKVKTVSYELPKSFCLCSKYNSKNTTVYISQLSSLTLFKRTKFIENLNE